MKQNQKFLYLDHYLNHFISLQKNSYKDKWKLKAFSMWNSDPFIYIFYFYFGFCRVIKNEYNYKQIHFCIIIK